MALQYRLHLNSSVMRSFLLYNSGSMKHEITRVLPERFKIAVGVNVILRQGNQYLLLRRANTGWADGYYTVPAGHLDGGESLTAAAAREAKEEIGVTIGTGQLQLVHVMHRSDKEDDQARLDFWFVASTWQGEPYIAEPDKADSFDWFELAKLPEKTLENVSRTLKLYESQLLSELNW
jgi:8-oxo-dGTP diphosphatase